MRVRFFATRLAWFSTPHIEIMCYRDRRDSYTAWDVALVAFFWQVGFGRKN